MIALRLATTIFELSLGSEMSAVAREDIMERFESLRSYRKLPRGRERRNQQLTNGEIAAVILGLVPPDPKWAGHAAAILCMSFIPAIDSGSTCTSSICPVAFCQRKGLV
jgi:hypothetical protein